MSPTTKPKRYRPKVATKAELAFEMAYYAEFRKVHARLVKRSKIEYQNNRQPTSDSIFNKHHEVPVLNYRRFPEPYQRPRYHQWQAKDY